MDGDRSAARDALRAASASLADGLSRIRVASAVRGGGAPPEEGESFVPARAGGGTPLLPSGASLRGQLSQFLPGGLGFSGVATGGGSLGGRTILPSDHGSVGGSFQILNGFETRVNTPLTDGERGESFGHQPGERVFDLVGAFASLPGRGLADDDVTSQEYDVARGGFLSSDAGVGAGNQLKTDARRLSAPQGPAGLDLYGPHAIGESICGGTITRGLQGQLPDRFCLKRGCRFTTHAAKSSLGRLQPGAYYVKENDAHAYSELCLTAAAAALSPGGLLSSRNNMSGWKAIFRQLEDQAAADELGSEEEVAAQAAGLAGFAERVLKTPYAVTPMRGARRRVRMNGDDEEDDLDPLESTYAGGVTDHLQRLEDSVAHLRGELGIHPPESRYITLHGGVVALGDDYVQLYDDYKLLAQGLSDTVGHVRDARAEAAAARVEAAALATELGQWRGAACTAAAVEGFRLELREVKADREALEDTVLAVATAVNGLIGQLGQLAGQPSGDVDARMTAHVEAVNGRLDSIRQEMKGGGITVGGVVFSGQEAAMDWARIHMPPNTYQCIGGMNYAMCLISEAVVHQEDMMKREEHGERVKRTFMQSAQVLSVHSSYPPVLDGVKAAKRDSGVDFLELKSYKHWKPVDGEGTSKKITEGVERSFDLIKNAIEFTFGMKPQARIVLLDLVTEFKMLFHELFAMEVNMFYETTLNKVGGEHPSEASKTQCWALVTKLLKTIFQATHKARRFATEAGGPDMDPLRTNGYFFYAALEELRVLKEFSRVKWRRHEEFGYNMLGFVFENSVSKAVLDARPNPILKVTGLEGQLQTIKASMDQIQTNLAQVRSHAGMPAMKPLAKKARVAEID